VIGGTEELVKVYRAETTASVSVKENGEQIRNGVRYVPAILKWIKCRRRFDSNDDCVSVLRERQLEVEKISFGLVARHCREKGTTVFGLSLAGLCSQTVRSK